MFLVIFEQCFKALFDIRVLWAVAAVLCCRTQDGLDVKCFIFGFYVPLKTSTGLRKRA